MRAIVATSLSIMLLAASCDARLAPPLKVANVTADGQTTQVALPVPPRFMWGWGDGLRGYCGSFSFQSFGILYGNYISAQPMRDAADTEELLIAKNDEIAANAMRFAFESWDWNTEKAPQADGFASWVADHIDMGHGVVAGMFEQKDGGDADYDHIMPVFGYLRDETKYDASRKKGGGGQAIRQDVAGLYYNDLYRATSLFGDLRGSYVQSRKNCAAPNGIQPLAAPYEFCLPANYDYGIALMGNRDDKSELFASRLVMPSWTEPDWGLEDELHEPIVTFTPDLIVSGLTPGKNYTVLRFDHPLNVPVEDFIHGAYSKRFDIVATQEEMTLAKFDSFQSDATVFYRTIAGSQ